MLKYYFFIKLKGSMLAKIKNYILLCFLVLFSALGYTAGIPEKFENEVAMEYALNLPQEGILHIKEGYLYLKVDDRYIHHLFPLLEQSELEIPDYFRSPSAPGAHISVIYETERQQLPPQIPEVGQTFDFYIKDFYSIFLRDHEEIIVLVVESPMLEDFRVKYGLSEKLLGHEYHITLALKHYPANQVIMKELRFWYNTKWLEYKKKWDPYGTWGNKPYMTVKGLPDDYKHLTRKDLRIWWNTRKPGSYPQVDGYEDDDTIVTQTFLENWFKTVSPDGRAP